MNLQIEMFAKTPNKDEEEEEEEEEEAKDDEIEITTVSDKESSDDWYGVLTGTSL